MRKRLVYRADDLGYTPIYDDGFFKAIEDGIVTSADIMMDFPCSTKALERLKNYPWISIGWHSGHLWGFPVAGVDRVPSMVNADGRFKWRKNKRLQNEVTYEDAYTEFKEQMELFISIMGKAPDTAEIHRSRPIDLARRRVCDEYGVVINCAFEINPDTGEQRSADEKYQHLNYYQSRYFNAHGYDLAYFKEYDLMNVLTNLHWTNDEIWRVGGHPGYLDDFIFKESSCALYRVKDLCDVTSQRIKDYIINNHIELINQRDVIYGTNEYQDHLKKIGSSMWAGNWS